MEADERGVTQGFAVSFFDATDLSDPVLLDKQVEERRSYSEAQWDPHALRAIRGPPTPDGGDANVPLWMVLVVPLRVYSWQSPEDNFDGFSLYNVSYHGGEGSIQRMFKISHANADAINYGCWSPYWVPARSLLIDGNLTTIKRHTVVSTNVDAEERLWTMNLTSFNDACSYSY